MTSRTERADAGFTLLEVIVIVVILALVGGLVLQRGPQRSPTLDLRAAGEEVARTLRLARAQAIATDRPVMVRLDVDRHAFAVDGGPVRALPGSLALDVLAAGGGRAPAIGFAPDGSSSGGRIVMGERARRLEIAVNWLTGRVDLGRMSVVDAR